MKSSRRYACSRIATAVLLLAVFETMASAEVTDSAANGFTVKITTSIHAAPADVYSKLLRVGDWWSSDHTFSRDSHNLSIEDRPMGCFCEKLAYGGGVRHMTVVFVAPEKKLRMSGALGPLQALGATGAMTFELSSAESGTHLAVTYAVAGYLPQGLNTLAPVVDEVLSGQVVRLKNLIETGNPAGKTPPQKSR